MPTRRTTKQDQAVGAGEAQQHGFCADRCPNRCVGGLCKELQMPTRRSTKQLEREKHNSMAFALISDRSDALEDLDFKFMLRTLRAIVCARRSPEFVGANTGSRLTNVNVLLFSHF
uniref:Uncharacterized protein n=1 Tax=Globodera pallida TaxID=36090 RepID=A0A183C6X2_GLOPA